MMCFILFLLVASAFTLGTQLPWLIREIKEVFFEKEKADTKESAN
jgi:uncharacterized protein (UPF0264 family)